MGKNLVKITITDTFNDVFTDYKDKVDSMTITVDLDEQCECFGHKICGIHRMIEKYGCVKVDEDVEIKPVYDLKTDMESGAIEIFYPDKLNEKIKYYDILHGYVNLYGKNKLEVCNMFMNMYKYNYGGKEKYPEAQKRIDKWEAYIKHNISIS